jgi:hypothetical protein
MLVSIRPEPMRKGFDTPLTNDNPNPVYGGWLALEDSSAGPEATKPETGAPLTPPRFAGGEGPSAGHHRPNPRAVRG